MEPATGRIQAEKSSFTLEEGNVRLHKKERTNNFINP